MTNNLNRAIATAAYKNVLLFVFQRGDSFRVFLFDTSSEELLEHTNETGSISEAQSEAKGLAVSYVHQRQRKPVPENYNYDKIILHWVSLG